MLHIKVLFFCCSLLMLTYPYLIWAHDFLLNPPGNRQHCFSLFDVAVVQAFPENAISWYAVACYYLLLGRLSEARAFFSKATGIDSRCAEAWYGFFIKFTFNNKQITATN